VAYESFSFKARSTRLRAAHQGKLGACRMTPSRRKRYKHRRLRMVPIELDWQMSAPPTITKLHRKVTHFPVIQHQKGSMFTNSSGCPPEPSIP